MNYDMLILALVVKIRFHSDPLPQSNLNALLAKQSSATIVRLSDNCLRNLSWDYCYWALYISQEAKSYFQTCQIPFWYLIR